MSIAQPWYQIGEQLPADGAIVYFRVANNDYFPFKGPYNASSEIFTDTLTSATYNLAIVREWSPNYV